MTSQPITPPSVPRLQPLQALRAIAAIMVVWFHAMFLAKERGLESFQTSLAYLDSIGAAGVDIFFVISGFIVSLTAVRATSARAFFTSRIRRVWPIYAIATLLFLLVNPGELADPERLITSLLLLEPPNPWRPFPTLEPGWSLLFEVGFYGMIAVALMWRSPRSLPERIAIVAISCILVGGVSGYWGPLNILGNPIALEFLMGVGLGVAWKRWPTPPAWVAQVAFITGAIILLATAMYGTSDVADAIKLIRVENSWERVRIWGIGAALVVASAVFRSGEQRARVWSFLGDASYSIYLFHMHVITAVSRAWPSIGNPNPDLAIIAATIVAVGFGVLMYVSVERPLIQWLKRGPGSAAVVVAG